jgi:hypothetical protein
MDEKDTEDLMRLPYIVNGELVAEKGKHTGRFPGMILYGYGKDSGEKK